MKLDFEYGSGLMSAELPDNTDVFIPGTTVPDPPCLPQDWDTLYNATLESIRHPMGMPPLRELAGPAADGDRRDLGLAAALQRSLAVVLLSRDEFEPGVLERVVDALIDDTLDALYGPEDAKGDDAR